MSTPVMGGMSGKARGKTGKKTREKTREKLLRLIRENPSTTAEELATSLGITSKGVEWQIRRLKVEGVLKRIGPDKGGHWEILE